jgi:hypothetical protein
MKSAGNLLALYLSVLLLSCSSPANEKVREGSLVAQAGDEALSKEDFADQFVSTGLIKDSLFNAHKTIESWATESLFYQEAINRLNPEEINVDKQVEDYRRSLVNFIYQTRVIEANLDTVISNEEVESYYNDHRNSFILRDNILKVNYLKVPVLATGLQKIKKLIWSTNAKDKEQLLLLCSQNAENFFMNDSTWLFLEDIKKEIPSLREQPDYVLGAGRVLEFEDDQYYYYLKVKDLKVKNAFSPINFERQNIRKFIMNHRKTQLITQYKASLLERAKSEKKFVILSEGKKP